MGGGGGESAAGRGGGGDRFGGGPSQRGVRGGAGGGCEDGWVKVERRGLSCPAGGWWGGVREEWAQEGKGGGGTRGMRVPGRVRKEWALLQQRRLEGVTGYWRFDEPVLLLSKQRDLLVASLVRLWVCRIAHHKRLAQTTRNGQGGILATALCVLQDCECGS